MTLNEVIEAVNDAKRTLRLVDHQVSAMATICAGRLREACVPGETLAKLKHELRDYNIHTGLWRED